MSKLIFWGVSAFVLLLVAAVAAFYFWESQKDKFGAGENISDVLPDLVPVGIEYDGRSDTLKQVVTVENQGARDVNVPVSIKLSLHNSTTGSELIAPGGAWNPVIINGLKGGAQGSAVRNLVGWTLSDATAYGGKWRVFVDSNSVVKESDEGNNTRPFQNK